MALKFLNDGYFAGKVGIGTANPGSLLHLVGTTPELRIATAADGQTARLGLYEDSAGTHHGGYIQYVGGGDTLRLGIVNSTINTDVITIKDNFNVGIGTSSPDRKLEIADSLPILRLTDTRNLNVGDWDDVSLGKIEFKTSDTTTPGARVLSEIEAYSNANAASGPNSDLRFKTSQNTDSSPITRMTIRASGNVGIGTESPSAKLDVQGTILVNNEIQFVDANMRIFRSSNDMVLRTAGSNRITIASTGQVKFDSYGGSFTGASQYLLGIDGSGNIVKSNSVPTVGNLYLPLAGNTTATAMTGNISLENTKQVRFLTSGNLIGLRLQSSGTSSFIDNEVGDMYIRQEADGNNIFFQADNGAGGNTTYFSVRPNNGARTQFEKNTRHNDGIKASFGTGDDLQIYHGDTNSHIDQNGSGDLYIKNSIEDGDIYFQGDDGTGTAVTNYFTINGGGGETRFQKFTRHNDGVKAQFGNSDDLQIYHNNTDSYSAVVDVGTGYLLLGTDGPFVLIGNSTATETYIKANNNGSVDLYYDNSKKFETTSTGVTVTGQITTTGTSPSILFNETDVTANWRNRVSSGSYRVQYASDGSTFSDYVVFGASTNTIAKDTTFTEQAFSAATSSGDGSSTLTTKGYVDSLITGATIYRGTWDPDVSLNSGYGSPDLSGVTQTSGYYYICSADGTAHPNGTTGTPAVPCEPNSWNTGDWVIWNDDIVDCAGTGTGAWQKIDNSSVLSGVGTGQTVALWEGASSVTDSETLGNAPITVSGNDTTFAGNVGVGGSPGAKLDVNSGSTNTVALFESTDDKAFIRIKDHDTDVYLISKDSKFYIGADSTSYEKFNVDISSGNVGIGTANPSAFDTTATKLHIKNGGSSGSLSEVARFEGSSDADGSGGTIRLGTSNDRGIYFEGGRTGSVPYGKIGTTEYNGAKTVAITLDSSGNSTFAGVVTAPEFSANVNNVAALRMKSTTSTIGYGVTSANKISWSLGGVHPSGYFFRTTGANPALEIEANGNSTFAGDITIGANYIGRDGDNYIGFQSDDLIKFRVAGATQVKISDGVFTAQTDSDVDLGSSGVRFKELWVDSINGGSVVPGSYLPLTAGSTEPLTGDLYIAKASNQGELFFGTADANYKIFGGGNFGYMGYNTGVYHRFLTNGTEVARINYTGVAVKTTGVTAALNVLETNSTSVKATRIGNDTTSIYFYNTQADAVLAWTCGSYHHAEVVITASQTNGGAYNNLYIRGIWSNNHTSHHWDELEHVGGLTGSTITMSVGQNGSTTNSGRLELDFNYISASFATLNVRVTDFYGTHSYTIT